MNQLYINILVGLLIIGVVAFRLSRERKFGMSSLWLWPALMLVLVAADVWYERVISPLDVVYMFLGLAAGTVVGWYQGHHSTIRVDKAARAAFVKASPVGAVIFVAALAFRSGARYVTGSFSAPDSSGHLSPLAALVSAIALTFAVGLLTGLRLYVKRAYDDAPV